MPWRCRLLRVVVVVVVLARERVLRARGFAGDDAPSVHVGVIIATAPAKMVPALSPTRTPIPRLRSHQ